MDDAVVTNDFWYFDVDEDVIKRDFFYWLTSTPLFLEACVKSSKGETQRIRLQKNLFLNFELQLPSIKEQDYFLKKIDSADLLVKHLGHEITKQSNCVSEFRQRILQEAIEGKLTVKWRKQHPELISGDNHASKLFVKIQKEKEQLIKEGKINKEKRLSPIIEKEKPFDLPQGWIWCRLGNISEWRYGKSLVKTQYKSNGKYPVFGSNGIVGYFDKYLTSKPSIVIGRKGSAGALNKSEMPSWTTDVAFYIEESKFINFVYLFILLKSLKIDNIGKGIKPGINRNEAYNLLIPLAPADEQKAIVEKVTQIMSLIDKLEKRIAERKELSDMLMQVVLREAFDGN